MRDMREIKVGLIGFGTVGAGVVKILQHNSGLIEKRMGAKIVLKRIADIDLKTDRGVKLRPRLLTQKAEDVIGDPGIDIDCTGADARRDGGDRGAIIDEDPSRSCRRRGGNARFCNGHSVLLEAEHRRAV